MDKTPSQEMLAHAEKLCAQRGVRLTPQRLEVLRLMSLQQGAISAYDLLDLLREKEPPAKPPTVYRALDRFCAAGLLQRSVDGQRVTRYWLAAPAAHDQAAPHMECSGCHQPFQLGEGSAAVQAALQALRQALAHSGVRNPTLDVAVQGECAQCAAETSPPVSSPPSGNSP